MIALLVQFGPWIATALAGIFALITHLNGKAKVAAADQRVAEAQTVAQQAKTDTAEARDAEAQANAAAAQAGAQALEERTDVENDVAALPSGAAAQQLRDEWSRPGEDAGRGTTSAGQDPIR